LLLFVDLAGKIPTKQFYVFLFVVLLPVCHNYLVVALLVEPVEMSGRKKGKSLFPVYSLLLPAATYRLGECLEFPLGDICGARVTAMGNLRRILQKACISSVCVL